MGEWGGSVRCFVLQKQNYDPEVEEEFAVKGGHISALCCLALAQLARVLTVAKVWRSLEEKHLCVCLYLKKNKKKLKAWVTISCLIFTTLLRFIDLFHIVFLWSLIRNIWRKCASINYFIQYVSVHIKLVIKGFTCMRQLVGGAIQLQEGVFKAAAVVTRPGGGAWKTNTHVNTRDSFVFTQFI